MILLVASYKGGSGKTTTAINLAAAMAEQGSAVCLVDADRQRSAAAWHQAREEAGHQPPITLIEKLDNVSSTVRELGRRFDAVVVDVAGRGSRELITAASVADLLVAPCQCSQLDLDALAELDEALQAVRDLNPTLTSHLLQTMGSTHAAVKEQERADFTAYAADFPAFSLLQTVIRYRKAYRDAVPYGLAVTEAENPAAADEIRSLLAELQAVGVSA